MNGCLSERFHPRREEPRLLGWRVRRLVAPDGSSHRVKVPVYGPPLRADHVMLPVIPNPKGAEATWRRQSSGGRLHTPARREE